MSNTTNQTAKHTPGPWKFDDNEGCRNIKGGKRGTGRQGQYLIIAFTTGLANDETDRANARLIADAPVMYEENIELKKINAELLKVLQYIKDDADKFDDGIVKKGGCVYKMIAEAITKATGGTK